MRRKIRRKKREPRRLLPKAYSNRGNKLAEKLRNLSQPELENRERELADQIFRLKFQLNMGQSESLKKIHALRKDLARVKTLLRGRKLKFEPAGAAKK